MERVRYRVGIDVGSYSLGLSAIAVDEDDFPIEILSSVSLIHDSGLDPDKIKEAVTRLASSGIARRTRRLYRRKRRRLIALDSFLENQGWITKEFEEYSDPFYPWRVRDELVSTPIADETERGEKLSIAFRHIARHRGWRNPYSKVDTLKVMTEPTSALEGIRELASKSIGRQISEGATLANIVVAAELGKQKLRGPNGLLSARLHQSDYATEIIKIAKTQGLDDDLVGQIIDKVFAAESPKGSAAGRVGKDPLQPTKLRALKATEEFQNYRIAALIANLRIRVQGEPKRLSAEENKLIFDYLRNLPIKEQPTWLGVAEILGIDRGDLLGTATMTDDGERAGSKPPVFETHRAVLNSKIKPLVAWWNEANDAEKAAMIKAMSNAEVDDFDSPAGAKVQAFFSELDDETHAKLDSLHLPIGRAAYCENTLVRLTKRMLTDGMDLYEARKAEFGIPNDWVPPAPEIGEPVGNPAVDRVLKGVARWLLAAESAWGSPLSINIEHVRAAFISESETREIEKSNKRREKRNLELIAQMNERLGIKGKPRRGDLWRFQSIQRQNCQCAYCGLPIDFKTCEMDHIVPQMGQGSTNKRENLVAVCKPCNSEKSNIPFAVWAEKTARKGVSVAEAVERTRHWVSDPGLSAKQFAEFTKDVRQRLMRKTRDEEIDARSIESVAWMANELRSRIAQRYKDAGTEVRVYKGALTAEARAASGITGQLRFIDGTGKSRLDRRHHAVDAAVIAFVSNYVAETLAIRSNQKFCQEIKRMPPQWKEFTGKDPAHRAAWNRWLPRMNALANLLTRALDEDRIVVMSNLRLRFGNGSVHEDTIGKLKQLKVGDGISAVDIDRASSEALWCALTRDPEYDPKTGLPENPNREIRIHGTRLNADDTITVFPVGAGALAVRGGYVELGSSFHHARIYKVPSGKNTAFCMMRVYAIDLQKYRNEDLFSVKLKPQTMSVRQCEPKLRKALAEGTAEYLGWIVTDDELMIDPTSFNTGQVAEAQKELGVIKRWRVDGFYSDSKLRLRPLQMSAEGLSPDASTDTRKILDRPGWLPAVNKLFANGNVTVIRRDVLGRPRLSSHAHLPVSWQVK
ncbi:MAG: HNH endonuclease [Corynebacterium sp.]|uniref:type II CRISPR RNA-guided endonuclease Cas9 n=1 Tax=Corynebacterium sp. TaxID=1720 RepID=UPI0026DBE1B8|nr:type II CRISPR RNA-guided endonuclease Cas9 [Corynebacterium sp.]MDO5099247.1 HNH endonuclease [Corynebacterium sp.]